MAATTDQPVPIIRIRRAPSLEPPTDDARRPDEHPHCPDQLALFTSLHSPTSVTLGRGRRVRLTPAVPQRDGVHGGTAGATPGGTQDAASRPDTGATPGTGASARTGGQADPTLAAGPATSIHQAGS